MWIWLQWGKMAALEINYPFFKRTKFSKLMIIMNRKLSRGRGKLTKPKNPLKKGIWKQKATSREAVLPESLEDGWC